MRIGGLAIWCAACSGSSSAPLTTVDAPPAGGSFVQAISSGPMTGGSAAVQIQPTGAGDLLVAMIMQPSGSNLVAGMQAGSTQLDSWLQSSALDAAGSSCPTTTQIWVSGRVSALPAGVSSVAIDMHGSDTFVVDVFEFSGVTAPAAADDGVRSGTPGSAPALPADPGDIVLSTLATCGDDPAIAAMSPFTALDSNDDGASAAYYIPATSGAFGATWSYDGGPWDATTTVFE